MKEYIVKMDEAYRNKHYPKGSFFEKAAGANKRGNITLAVMAALVSVLLGALMVFLIGLTRDHSAQGDGESVKIGLIFIAVTAVLLLLCVFGFVVAVRHLKDGAEEVMKKAAKNSGLTEEDMREFELYGTVGAVVCVCDSINYLLEEEEIVQTFRLVNNYLFPGGVFLFDFNTVYKYAAVIGDTTIAENREDCSFIWDNYYHEAEEINEYDLTVFVRETGQKDAELYRRFQETHYQRGYRLEQMKGYLRQAGLAFLEALDADTMGAVRDVSERIYVVARKG